MKKLKVAIIGAGNIARSAHLPAYEKMKDLVEVVAIADLDIQRAQEVAQMFNIPHVYKTIYSVIKGEPELDYVDICVWTEAHAALTIMAANHGLNILCEKPLAASLKDALAMEKAVKENGVNFMLAVVTRYSAEAQKCIELRDQGKFGDIYLAKASYVRRRGTPGGWFTDKALAGGGPVLDIGVHCIDRAWYLMGRPKPVSVSAETSYRIGNYQTKGVTRWEPYGRGNGVFDTEDSAIAFIRFEDGKVLNAEVSWAINGPEVSAVQLFGDKAGCTFKPLTVYGENEEGYLSDEKYEVEDIDGFEAEIRHFISCLTEHKTPISPIEDGVTIQRILDGIYRSAKRHKEVAIKMPEDENT